MPKKEILYYQKLLENPNVEAYLQMIRKGEGTLGYDGYNKLIGGGSFADFSRHPNIYKGKYNSTAAGAYQFVFSTWLDDSNKLSLQDFTPENQDLAAVYEIGKKRGAINDILSGDIISAIEKTRGVWVSLPGAKHDAVNKYSQTLPEALAFYTKNGGLLNEDNRKIRNLNAKHSEGQKSSINYLSKDAKRKTYNSFTEAKDIAKASTLLGPPGLIIGLGVLATDEIATVVSKAKERVEVSNKLAQIENKQNSMAAKSIAATYSPRAIDTQKATYSQLSIVPANSNDGSDSFTNNALISSPLPVAGKLQMAADTLNDQSRFDFISHIIDNERKHQIENLYEKNYVPALFKNTVQGLLIDDGIEMPRSKEKNSSAQENNRHFSIEDTIHSSDGSNGDTINIHLNRPMIEHFTINAKDVKEGLSDFKHKVEEVLLEILNSANAIQ